MKLYILFTFLFIMGCNKETAEQTVLQKKPITVSPSIKKELNDYLQQENSINHRIAFLVDFSYKSNRKRMMVYDVEADSILTSGLVAHGSCENTFEEIKYSNTEDSHCSSLGKYKIGYPYQGQYGLAYKLHGLDYTNSNAFKRFIVLHAHDCVPNNEPAYQICVSWGCPTVSTDFLQTLKSYIDISKQPILLWQYDHTYKVDSL